MSCKYSVNYPFLPVPTELSFEPINLCNAKCYCCPYAWLGEDADYRGKKMTPEQIEILIEDFANGLKIHRVQEWNAHIQPWRFSDPLVCPSLELILELADRFKINVIITTNGISFTDKNCRILDKYQHLIKKINISIIGINAEDIKKYMGVNWEVTKKRFLAAKENWPRVSSMMTIGVKDALDRPMSNDTVRGLRSEYRQYTKGIVKIKRGWLHNRMSQGDGVWTEPKQFSIHEKQFVQGCTMDFGKILRRLEVMVDGTAVLCCDDATQLTNYGNVFEDGIEKIWKRITDEHKLIYDKMYSERKKNLICNTCSRASFKVTDQIQKGIVDSQNRVLQHMAV